MMNRVSIPQIYMLTINQLMMIMHTLTQSVMSVPYRNMKQSEALTIKRGDML